MALTNNGKFKIKTTETGTDTEFDAKAINISFESLAHENSGRDISGMMHLFWVYQRVRKIKIELPPCTAATVSNILSKVQGQDYWITYFDPLDNAEKTIHAYTSSSTSDCYSGVISGGLYKGVSFTAIQMDGEKDAA